MGILRRFPALRLRVKMLLAWHGMMIADSLADDESLLARKRAEYGRRTMMLIRYHRRLRALTLRPKP